MYEESLPLLDNQRHRDRRRQLMLNTIVNFLPFIFLNLFYILCLAFFIFYSESSSDIVQQIFYYLTIIVTWVIGICLHEFGHAIFALYGGDDSVKDKGYLYLNPIKYVSPLKSFFIPLVMMLITGNFVLFGASVFIDFSKIVSKKWELTINLAGPLFTLLYVIYLIPFTFLPHCNAILSYCIRLQICALVLNLFPLPPLDGFHALLTQLPYLSNKWSQLSSEVILLVEIVSLGFVYFILWPTQPVQGLINILHGFTLHN